MVSGGKPDPKGSWGECGLEEDGILSIPIAWCLGISGSYLMLPRYHGTCNGGLGRREDLKVYLTAAPAHVMEDAVHPPSETPMANTYQCSACMMRKSSGERPSSGGCGVHLGGEIRIDMPVTAD